MKSVVDSSWDYYHQTILSFPSLSIDIDLRSHLSDESRFHLKALWPTQKLVVITPDNPYGNTISESTNKTRRSQLEARLDHDETLWTPANGMSPCRSHIEYGYGIDKPIDQSLELAIELGQSAIFYFDSEQFWLYGAAVKSTPVLLPR